MAASILHATCTGWLPERDDKIRLDYAHLQNAAWPGIDLSGLQMNEADLSGSGLARARFNCVKANLRFADLRSARIDDVDFYLVDLRGAKFTQRQLEHFHSCRAILDE